MSRVGPDIHRGPGTFVCTQACRRAIPKLGCATSILPSSDVGACTSTCLHPYHSAPGPTLQQFQRGRQSAQVCRRHLISRPRATSSNDSPLNYQHYASSSGRSEEELEPQPDARQAATGQGWMPQVPWGWDTIVKVMALWMVGFLATGNWLVPLSLDFLGLVPEELSFRGHALVHLLVDMMELVFTMLLLWAMLRQFKPLRHGLFRLDLRVGWWLVQVLVACLAFPAIDGLAHVSQSWFPAEGDFLATRLEQSLTAGDAVTGVLYFLVVSLCAPVWEETIFRGFLLTSLTRFMPPHLAVVASSVAFALCHFSLTRFVPLLVLGVVIGGVFVSSRNLLSPIALHSFWNFYIFFQFSLRSLQIV